MCSAMAGRLYPARYYGHNWRMLFELSREASGDAGLSCAWRSSPSVDGPIVLMIWATFASMVLRVVTTLVIRCPVMSWKLQAIRMSMAQA